MNTQFWLYNPNILFKSSEISNIWPMNEMTFESKLNAVTRFVILLTIIGYLITNNFKILLSGLVTLGAIIIFSSFSDIQAPHQLKELLAII